MASSSSGSPVIRPSPAPSIAASTTSTEASNLAPPTAPTSDQGQDDSSKIKTLLGILRKFIGVTDIASVYYKPRGHNHDFNWRYGTDLGVEYWNYLERPETFISIGDSEDALGRMLAVLRFWFTKDLKYVKGKPVKPYNSTLGEFFRCNWDVEDTELPILGKAQKSAATKSTNKAVRVSYITEQTSHHPPVSAFFVDCPEKGITARGFDQLSAKFTGTSIRVTPGCHNLGIFINLPNRDNEEYQLTHPVAHLTGILRGSLSVTVGDACYVTCPKSRIKVIIHYVEEGWLGKTQNKVVGVIYNYDPEDDNKKRIKDVPERDILARIEGCWYEQLYYTLTGSKDTQLLVDLQPLLPVPKIVPPEKEQLPNESRRFWHNVTQAILNKQFALATKLKQELEERQREKEALRVAHNEQWNPRFFTGAVTPIGRPDLNEEGKLALRGLHAGDYRLVESRVTGA